MAMIKQKQTLETSPGKQVTTTGRLLTVARNLLRARESGVLSALLLLCLIGTFTAPGFLSFNNLLTVGQQVAQIGIMAVGMTFVIITGEIDLSVGSIYALGAVVTGLLLMHGQPIWVACLAGLAAGCAAGLINGLATVYLRLPSFIVTLGSLSAIRGLTLLISNGAPISLDGNNPTIQTFSLLGQGFLFGVVPMELVFMFVIFLVGFVLIAWTRFGFHLYAVGGSREAARLCGINVARVRIASFALLGTLSAFAGILGLSFLNYVQGVTGEGLELVVISSVIIGGTALFGGSGTIWGTLIGVFLIGVLQNILVLSGLSSFWQTLVVGVIIVLAVALDTWLQRGRTQR
jgi:ribose/xylose/arabinose/galactoside ABC-type transport system permease subunit